MRSFSHTAQRFFIFFFTALSLVVIVLGITRIKKSPVAVDTGTPPRSPSGNATGGKTYTGNTEQTPWGNAVAAITVKDGRVVAVTMPKVPDSPPSIYAQPYLVDQALRAGNANIQGVTGATYTSLAFKASLENALADAKRDGETVTGGTSVGTTPSAKPIVPRKYREDDEDEWEDDDWFR